jgi:uncharacterized protein YjiS (DUF1127 family)
MRWRACFTGPEWGWETLESMHNTHAMAAKIPFEPCELKVQIPPMHHAPLEWKNHPAAARTRGWLGRARAAFRALWGAWTASRTRAQLSSLNDHTLRDIGIDRAQIDSLFR